MSAGDPMAAASVATWYGYRIVTLLGRKPRMHEPSGMRVHPAVEPAMLNRLRLAWILRIRIDRYNARCVEVAS